MLRGHHRGAQDQPSPSSFEINEASIVGNVDVNDSIDEELKLDQNDPKYNLLTRINAGDQLSLAAMKTQPVHTRAGHSWLAYSMAR